MRRNAVLSSLNCFSGGLLLRRGCHRAILVELRCRAGEDPWDVIPELPSVDEQVVIALRADALHLVGPADESGMAIDDELAFLRGIALWHPELSSAVWSLMGRLQDVGGRP